MDVEKKYDVGIIGCGPVGMTAACLLAQFGHTVLLLERRKILPEIPRAIHFDAETLRIWQKLGLHEQLLARTMQTEGLKIENAKGKLLLKGSNQTACGFVPNHMFYQPDLENILLGKVRSYENIELKMGYEYISHQEENEKVAIDIKETDSGRRFIYEVKYLIGCDGANSRVRQNENISTKSFHYQGHSLKTDVFLNDLNLKKQFPTAIVKTASVKRPKVFVSGFGKHLRWEFLLSKREIEAKGEIFFNNPQSIEKRLSPYILPKSYQLKHVAIYHFKTLISKTWQKGQVFIAGDAAHQMPPFIGQGMCSGIRDADNLGWKMDLVLRGEASDHIFTSYQKERQSHVTKLILLTLLTGYLFSSPLSYLLTFLSHVPLLNRFLLELKFPEEKLTKGLLGKSKLKGRLFPQFGGSDKLLGNDFALIYINNLSTDQLNEISKLSFVKSVKVENNELKEWFYQQKIDYVLVRPDRYIYDAGKGKGLNSIVKRLTKILKT